MLCTLQADLHAQAVLPVTPDIFWYSGCSNAAMGVYISHINTAMIDWQNTMAAGTLMVSAYQGNGSAGGVSFRDMGSGFTVNRPYCILPPLPLVYPYITEPDIIVGNDPVNPLTDYRVAVAYVNNFTALPTIDFFRVSYTGPATFTATPAGSITLPVAPGSGSKSIHIDIVAEYNNVLTTGYPWCDNFIVTWDDALANYASLGALSTFSTGPALPMMSAGTQTDVAAIQRAAVWPCGGACVPDIIGCFVTNSGSFLTYEEINFTTFTPPVSGAIGSIPGLNYNRPRIDAPDDLNSNHPAGFPNLCYYKVVTEENSSGIMRSFAYDNMSPALPVDDGWYLPCGVGAGTGPFSPTVAYGGNAGTQYQVAHFVDAIAGAGSPTTNVWMEPLSATFPASTTAPGLTGGSPFYYRVNTATPTLCNGVVLNSISTPCNNPMSKTLVAWVDNNPGGGPVSNVMYKVSFFSLPGGYAFRQPGGGNTPPPAPAQWKLYPDPAKELLTIESPVVTTYAITDILGRTRQSGHLQPGKQVMDITGLAAGAYILSTGDQQNMRFVKQ